MTKLEQYREFLRRKAVMTIERGFSVVFAEMNPILKPHQRVIVKWGCAGGCRAIFAKFGLGKSMMQLEIMRLSLLRTGGRGLITAPLGVRVEFMRDAAKLGIELRFIRRIEEAAPTGIYLTNFETVRDGKLDPGAFDVCSLDEASVLRGFGGSKTFREFMRLEPGRIAAIHVKDRIVPGGMTGLGFQTVYPFHAVCIEHFKKHGFAYMGMKTIVTDVVRENNQTYRLGWTEQCKDGTKMGVGMPEYLLLFRKPPSDNVNSYADVPVVKAKESYSRARWQTDAHGFARSSGQRLLTPEELDHLDHQAIFKLFRDYNLEHVYDFQHHVRIGEALEAKRILPVTFMLLQTPSWSPDVWTDVTRMQTLNGAQHAKGKEMHLCPMQFDIADRAIEQFTMEGETVFDPFGGLMTTAYRALKLKRKAVSTELNLRYFLDGCAYAKAMEEKVSMPTLFDTLEDETEIADMPAEVGAA